jgi:chromosome segregation ATPase
LKAVVPTNTEKIDALLKTTSSFEENLRVVNRDLDGLRKDLDGAENQIHLLDTRIARIEEALKHIKERLDKSDPNERLARFEEGLKTAEKELDKLRSSRFEIGKLILAAILGGAVAFGFNILTEMLKAARVQHQVQKTSP